MDKPAVPMLDEKQDSTSTRIRMLTKSEIESLRQEMTDDMILMQKMLDAK